MTHSIKVRNVEQALSAGFWWLKTAGVPEASRNGPVIVSPEPVVTEYTYPEERVVFNTTRDANPVFHLLEALWMLAGADNVGFLTPYNERMKEYAEDDGIIWGAYGQRWRHAGGMDQIHEVTELLREDPTSRRAVIAMWLPEKDLGAPKRDVPCNTHIYFDCRPKNGFPCLNMTVCCRSNDALWGAYGANAVHFSMLQELIATDLGVRMGVYRQFSNNFHAYPSVPQAAAFLSSPPESPNAYPHQVVYMLLPHEKSSDFEQDCIDLVAGRSDGVCRTSFFHRVVLPLKHAYDVRRAGGAYIPLLEQVADCDWKQAFIEWAARRAAPKGELNGRE